MPRPRGSWGSARNPVQLLLVACCGGAAVASLAGACQPSAETFSNLRLLSTIAHAASATASSSSGAGGMGGGGGMGGASGLDCTVNAGNQLTDGQHNKDYFDYCVLGDTPPMNQSPPDIQGGMKQVCTANGSGCHITSPAFLAPPGGEYESITNYTTKLGQGFLVPLHQDVKQSRLINYPQPNTAHTGGAKWADPKLASLYANTLTWLTLEQPKVKVDTLLLVGPVNGPLGGNSCGKEPTAALTPYSVPLDSLFLTGKISDSRIQGATITFDIAKLGDTFLQISNIQVHPVAGTGLGITNLGFFVVPLDSSQPKPPPCLYVPTAQGLLDKQLFTDQEIAFNPGFKANFCDGPDNDVLGPKPCSTDADCSDPPTACNNFNDNNFPKNFCIGNQVSQSGCTGNVFLTEWSPGAKLYLKFDAIEVLLADPRGGPAPSYGTFRPCVNVSSFQQVLGGYDLVDCADPKNGIQYCARACHGGAGYPEQPPPELHTTLMDVSGIFATPPSFDLACAEMRAQIAPGNGAQSNIFLLTNPIGNQNQHANEFSFCGSAVAYNNFKKAVLPWICDEGDTTDLNNQANNTNFKACNGECADLQHDANNCGACGAACKISGQVCQPDSNNKYKPTCVCNNSGQVCGMPPTCVDTNTDTTNCGQCGVKCNMGANTNCSNGVCCPNGQLGCSGKCTDPITDANNCGTCGTKCTGSTPKCVNGQCSM